MYFRIVGVSAAMIALAGTASAADLVSEPPAAPVAEAAPAFTWNGFYLGLQGGGAWGNGDFSGIGDANLNGGLVTGFAGYNWQLDNNIVLGVEGDASYNWDEERSAAMNTSSTRQAPFAPASVTLSITRCFMALPAGPAPGAT